MFLEYIVVLKYLFFALFLGLVLFAISFFLVYQAPYSEKLSTYECGFNPWGDARSKFEIRFYLVAILFIIFDLEIIFLFPWIVCVSKLSFFAIYSIVIFLFILTVGFVYEWVKGALKKKEMLSM